MIHNNLGLALKSRGEMNSAAAEYREALTLNPDYAPAHCNLGVIYLDRGQLDAAVSELRIAIGIDPDLAKAHWHLGRVLRRMGALLEAAAEFDRFAESTPNRARAESARREAERLRKLAKKLGQTQRQDG
jgi:tetratricopeptide (TPR) repeat protein